MRLFDHVITPVARPSLGIRALRSAQDVGRFPLLEYDDATYPWLQWSDWLRARGWADARPKSMQRFNQYDQVIQAAVDGQGIALGRLELLRDLLADGRLVPLAPARPRGAGDHAYWLVSVDTHPRKDVRLVARWIEGQAHEAAQALDDASGP